MKTSQQQAIMVGVQLQNQPEFENSMEELKNLAAACQIEVIDQFIQKANQPNSSYYIGTGKVNDLAALLASDESLIVIFNDELSPTQIRNLEGVLQRSVIDRTMLILDIFAERAQTREAQLQVEVAQLQYMLPRLVGLRESLGRQGGGAGLRNRGTGETKLELDRRKIEDRIAALQSELAKLVARRQVQRQRRKKNEMPVVCLVGYTNAGKSSLMNAIIQKYHAQSEKQVFVKDMLFATLETSVRAIELPDRKSFLLTDTVGFVSGLPHHLVKAFRSTLEEVAEADLLIHVVDYANPEHEQHIAVTEQTLQQLGADQIPVIYALNKLDLTDETYPSVRDDRVYLSVHQDQGIDQLIQQIRKQIFKDYLQCEVIIPYDQGQLVAYFNENAYVQSTKYEEEGTRLKLECRAADLEKYRDALLLV